MLHHVGLLVRDLESASAQWTSRFDLDVVRTFEAPDYALRAVFLGISGGAVELYTIDDADVLDAALGSAAAKLDHVALALGAAAGDEALTGCTIRGPGRPEPIDTPIILGDSRHVWTQPPGIEVLIQLITPAP